MHNSLKSPVSPEVGARLRRIVGLALPAAATMLSYSLVSLVDTLMVGQLGTTELAAVGLSNTLLFTGGALWIGLLGATATLTAQHEGAGQHAEAGAYLHQAAWLALFGGTLWGFFTLLGARPLLSALNPGENVVEVGSSYLVIRGLGLPLLFLTIARESFLQGLGDTRTPLRISIILNVVNVVFNYVFIYGAFGLPALGVAGAALGTVMAHAVSLLLYHYVIRLRHRDQPRYALKPLRGPSWPHLRKMLEVGLPMGVHFSLEIGSMALLTVFVSWTGEQALAANQIVLRVVNMLLMAEHGMAVATTSLVGRSVGAGRFDEARAVGRSSIQVCVAISTLLGLVMVGSASLWTPLFTADLEVVRLVHATLGFALAFIALYGLASISYAALQGAGDTRFPMMVGVACAWGVGVPVGYWAVVLSSVGGPGLFLTLVVQTTLTAGFNLWRFMGTAWYACALVAPREAFLAGDSAEGLEFHSAAKHRLAPLPAAQDGPATTSGTAA